MIHGQSGVVRIGRVRKMCSRVLTILALQFSIVAATPLSRGLLPTVNLDNATFTGVTLGRVSSFLGIPFAQPP